jgi:ParB-like chromosome segregation protein Spo0J
MPFVKRSIKQPFSRSTDRLRFVDKQDAITANDYNPNNVAPPEKRLLSKSLELDGFTQPIVVTESEPQHYEIVDGFHRHEIGKNRAALKRQLKGISRHLPA